MAYNKELLDKIFEESNTVKTTLDEISSVLNESDELSGTYLDKLSSTAESLNENSAKRIRELADDLEAAVNTEID
jgi:ElaB/YqjD/DUF883 family membrane-anchored ribosome-binding protein